MTQKSELEAEVERSRQAEAAAQAAKKVRCLCVQGTCREGESECHGGCNNGWTGTYCDVPTSAAELQHVNTNQKNDYTRDGLYRPQQISEERVASPAARRASTPGSET